MSVLKELLLKDYVTLTGTMLGTCAIILALFGVFYSDNFLIVYATFVWGGAMACDLFDGFVARKLKQVNEIGKEIDSLSDAVSFVVAPGMIILCASLNGEFAVFLLPPPAVMIGVLFVVFFGIIRLAWFNVENKGVGYTGLVTPLSAALIVLFYNVQNHFNRLAVGFPEFHQTLSPLANFFGNTLFVTIYMILIASLNVVPFLRYGLNMQKKRGVWKYYIIAFAIFLATMFISAGIFAGLNYDIATFIGFIFPLSFLFCVLGYVVYGFINYLSLRKKGEE